MSRVDRFIAVLVVADGLWFVWSTLTMQTGVAAWLAGGTSAVSCVWVWFAVRIGRRAAKVDRMDDSTTPDPPGGPGSVNDARLTPSNRRRTAESLELDRALAEEKRQRRTKRRGAWRGRLRNITHWRR